MRFPSFPTLLRTFYTFANATRFHALPQRSLSPFNQTYLIRSMPSIPFLSSFFGTSTPQSEKMSYPVEKAPEEWRAVLNKGELNSVHEISVQSLTTLKINSVFCAKKALKHLSPIHSTSKCPMKVSIPAQPARRHCTKPTTNSNLAAAGQHTSTQFREL